MEAPEQGIARSGSSSSSSSFDDERESDLLLFRNWLYYRVDSALGERVNQFKLLLFVLLVANAVMGNFLWFAGGLEGHRWGDTTFVATLWDTWTLLMDTGIQYYAINRLPRFLAAASTVLGLLFAAVLTGFVVDAVMEKMSDLRKGKSAVKEWNHTLLIGWTDRSIAFIQQICLANESEGGGVIVVLSEEEKEKMEADLHATLRQRDLLGSRVVFRSGSPLSSHDLRRAAAPTARSIVIMASGDSHYIADAATLRVVIALKTFPSLSGHVVVEVLDKEMEYLMRIVGGDEIETLITHETLARMSLSSIKQPGIAVAYENILGFEGDEFYTKKWPEMAGKTFGACVEHFPLAVPIGVVLPKGDVILMPDNDLVLTRDTAIIVVAEDDDSYEAKSIPYRINMGELPTRPPEPNKPDRLLFVGWTDAVKGMLEILNSIFDPGTELHLLNRTPTKERIDRLASQGMDIERDLYNLEVTHIVGNPAVWRTLRALDLNSYRCMLVISDEQELGDLMRSDSHNLAAILLLRHHNELSAEELTRLSAIKSHGLVRSPSPSSSSGGKHKAKADDDGMHYQPIFCEVLDTRTQQLIANSPDIGRACHFLVSNSLISKVLAMIAEDRTVRSILSILLSGVIAISLKGVHYYALPSERLSWFVLAKRAQKLNHILLGYQQRSSLESITINPKDKDIPKYWTDCDLIVIARDEKVAKNNERSAQQRTLRESGRQSPASPDMLGKTHQVSNTEVGATSGASPMSPTVATSLTSAFHSATNTSLQTFTQIDVPFAGEKPMGFTLIPVKESSKDTPPIISSTSPGGQADHAGVREGWKVAAVNNKPISNQENLVMELKNARSRAGHTVVITFRVPVAPQHRPSFNFSHHPLDLDHGAAHYSAIHGGVHGGATFAQMMSTTTDAAARELALFHRIAQLEAHLHQSPGTNSTQGVVKSGDGSSMQGIFEEGAKSLMNETIHGYRVQVVELQKQLEQERHLRTITERLLKQDLADGVHPQNRANINGGVRRSGSNGRSKERLSQVTPNPLHIKQRQRNSRSPSSGSNGRSASMTR